MTRDYPVTFQRAHGSVQRAIRVLLTHRSLGPVIDAIGSGLFGRAVLKLIALLSILSGQVIFESWPSLFVATS